jgi:hypothetical protein
LDSPVEEPGSFWARHIRFPQKSITRESIFRLTKLMRLYIQLHEMRHLVHIVPVLQPTKFQWLSEIDCDLFADGIFRQQLPRFKIDPAELLKTHRALRYTRLLCATQDHKIAPALDQNSVPGVTNYAETIAVASEILGRLQQEDKSVCIQTVIDEKPSHAYSLLRRLHGDGAFKNAAEAIVARILDSVEFFAKDISQHPDVINKTYPVLHPL